MRGRGRRNANCGLRSSCDILPDWHLAARAPPYSSVGKESSSEPRQRVHVDGTIADFPPLTAQTVKHHHRVLSQALKAARPERVIDRNPADDVKAPTVEPVDMKILDQAQTGALLGAAAGTQIYIPVRMAATTGMRRGEVLGLRWRDVDLAKGEAHVRQSLGQTKAKGLSFKSPKTNRGRRTIPLLPLSLAPLRAHRAWQKEDRTRAGSMWEDNDLVYCRPDGLPIDPDRFSKDFAALSQRLGLGVRLHDLRHSQILQLLGAGVSVDVVSERAGHKNAYVNLAIYAHTLGGMQWASGRAARRRAPAASAPGRPARFRRLIGWQTGWQIVQCSRGVPL